MASQSNPMMETIGKLAMAGEQAGFTVGQMVDMLNSGVTLETLLDMIALQLHGHVLQPSASSRWVV
jgi:hypothetical protein